MIWFILAILTAAAAMSVLLPLARARSNAGLARSEADVAFYESEAANIARDLSRGIIDEKEAESARAEAARRLLATSATSQKVGRGTAARRVAAVLSIVIIALAGAGLYGVIGLPNYPDQPLVARQSAPPDQMDVMAAIAKIEAHLARNPDDARGYEVVAPVYMRIGRFGEAAKAWGEAIRLAGPTPERLTLMGESLIFANDGKVTPEAIAAFERALSLNSAFPQARFYLGLAAEQTGEKEKAVSIWSTLLADAEPDAAWASMVRERLEGLGVKLPAAAPGVPQGEAAAMIAAMSEGERNVAIRGMVDSLATRLAANGDDVEGWLRLVRAYSVLKEPAKAKSALDDARRALAGKPSAVKGLEDLARELGIGG